MLNEASMEMMQSAFQPENDADKKLLVMFHEFPVQDRAASALEGRPIFKNQLYVTIMVPGDKDSIVDRRAEQRDFDRFPKQYQAYKNKQSQETAAGTPLSAVTFLAPAQIKELEFFNCYTVEQLASLPDTHANKFISVQRMKQLANDYLRAAKETAPLTAMREEMQQKDAQLEAQQAAIDDQARRLKAMEETLVILQEGKKK